VPIILSEGGNKSYTPHPEGTFAAVCVDVLDLGKKETAFGERFRVGLVFYCGKNEEGEQGPYALTVASFFNRTWNEKGALRGFVEQWKGKNFKLPNKDLEELIGHTALLQVQHNEHAGNTYANINSIMMLPEGTTAPSAPEGFVRMCEREDYEPPAEQYEAPKVAPPAQASEPGADLPWD
jgi:hypothetical protein